MEKREAEKSQTWFREEFMTPDGWVESYYGYPEPVVDKGSKNWWIANFEHKNSDIIITVESLSQKLGKEGVAWIEGPEVSQEKLHFPIKGGIGASIAANLNDEDIRKVEQENRPAEEIHPLAEKMIKLKREQSVEK
jgi:hypothetical protein